MEVHMVAINVMGVESSATIILYFLTTDVSHIWFGIQIQKLQLENNLKWYTKMRAGFLRIL